ncbi:pyridoxal phosphate-dependent aminotransferase [Ideonella sp.]|uniref:pyridoxal phosphate-dependent aminotransferase n=1 Tax=Ideonella sp. TaxID=1929293 RepID=UPI002B49DFDC|nr:pyridoxal phosphate-dependent aminotransferase [Ideonella sp.]HJV68030.1 pyridoxal phosphate-dependent aminotransferase [Ideonella sp.]
MNSELATPRTPVLASRLPEVGTTIFSVMSALAQKHGAVNLGQGFPDFDCDPGLVDAVTAAMRAGHNQYPPMPGVPALRQALSAKIERQYGHRYDPDTEVTITAGATQGILTAVLAFVHPGDDVIVLEPCYDSYGPAITLAGGRVVRVPLDPASFRIDFDRLAAALSPRTRAIIVNTPHNPTGTAWPADDRRRLAELLRPTDVLVLSDEVYEHMVFDGAPHASVSGDAELAARSLVISSFGKTYHVTGWKVGHVAAPAPLMAEFRKVHQFNVFTVNTPMQHGLAAWLAEPARYLELPAFYQRKRDRFRAGLAAMRFDLLPCAGSYFQCVDYSRISDLPDQAFCEWLTAEVGVAAIPLSAFYAQAPQRPLVRFCFAKTDATLDEALRRLARL